MDASLSPLWPGARSIAAAVQRRSLLFHVAIIVPETAHPLARGNHQIWGHAFSGAKFRLRALHSPNKPRGARGLEPCQLESSWKCGRADQPRGVGEIHRDVRAMRLSESRLRASLWTCRGNVARLVHTAQLRTARS